MGKTVNFYNKNFLKNLLFVSIYEWIEMNFLLFISLIVSTVFVVNCFDNEDFYILLCRSDEENCEDIFNKCDPLLRDAVSSQFLTWVIFLPRYFFNLIGRRMFWYVYNPVTKHQIPVSQDWPQVLSICLLRHYCSPSGLFNHEIKLG